MMKRLQAVAMLTKTILLINSESTLTEVVQACLHQLGDWEVLTVSSPVEGLKLAIQAQPDAILFDLCTFGMNFFTFLSRLHTQPATQQIPIVLIGTNTKWFDVNGFKDFQVAGIIDYACDPTQLPQQLAALLNWPELNQPSRAEDQNDLN